jgi:hypothetical protein
MPENQSRSSGPAGDANSEVYFEDTFPKETIDKLIGAYLDLMLIIRRLMQIA